MSRINYTQHSHEPFKALLALEKAVFQSSSLEPALLHLVKLRASQMNGCLFCVDMHSKEARKGGERELRLHHLPFWRESPLFSEKERACLAWTEQVTKLPEHGISDEQFRALREQLSEKEISDLTFAVGTINLWNRLGVPFLPKPGSADKLYGLEGVL
jgi:AhpD family alkylhydroperoxidase